MPDPTEGNDKDKLADRAAQLMNVMEQLSKLSTRRDADSVGKEHKFWDTQPVPQTAICSSKAGEHEDGPIEQPKEPSQIRAQPYPLPEEFYWCQVDIDNELERAELYQLLNRNYVEDAESLFRFDYPESFLEWALRAPGWKSNWHVGVRVSESKRLVAFISAIPFRLGVRDAEIDSVEVNFLCIHKKLRAKRLAPLLIKEITRRINQAGLFQALYTAGAVLPGVICKARYYHRPLNYRKLAQVGFAAVPFGKTLDQMILQHQLPLSYDLPAMRPMVCSDAPRVTELLQEYLSKFALRPVFTVEEVAHWLLPRPNLVYSYVIENEGQVTDFLSFYALPSTVNDNPLHTEIKVAYLFYYAAQSSASLKRIMQAALVICRDLGFDVFNCVEIMDNGAFLADLRFGEGDGHLHYYLYNWRTNPFRPSEAAVVML